MASTPDTAPVTGTPVTGPLTDLSPVLEANAAEVLSHFHSLGIDLARPHAVEAIQAGYQVALSHVITMQAAGQISADMAKSVIGMLVGLNQTVGDACHYVHSSAQQNAPAPRPKAPRRRWRPWNLLGLWKVLVESD
jgi:hypothetical protein